MENPEMKKQVELLGNNIDTFDVPKNYLNEAEVEIEELEKGLSRLKEKVLFAIRGLNVIKEGFEAVKDDMTIIIGLS